MKEERSKTNKRKRLAIFGIVLAALVLTILFGAIWLRPPARTVAAYCKVYSEQNTRLAKSTGTTYSVKVFDHSSSKAQDFALAFDKLDKVAPLDIEPDITTLKSIFESIQADPSNALTASLSGLLAETSVDNWTTAHCLD